MKKVGIIGGGIFGCSAAIELKRRGFDVTIFERAGDILAGASTNNHLRHHFGYHYPRSRETSLESIEGRESFEKEYGGCVLDGFPAYYAIAKEGSKSTPEHFLNFCKELNLQYKLIQPDKNFFNLDKISICLETPESAYDPEILKKIILKKLKELDIPLKLNHKIVGGEILKDGRKKLSIEINGKKSKQESFDYIVCSIYANFNKLNDWFSLPKKTIRYDLMELLDIQLPIKKPMAAMIVDGDFCTFVPVDKKGLVRLGHVKKSVLKQFVSDDLDTDAIVSNNTLSNKEEILNESSKYFPIVKKSKYVKSVFIMRVVNANVEDTDERPTEVTEHGNGIFSIFGGKVITCMVTAKKIGNILQKGAI